MTAAFPGIDLRHLRYFLAVYEELHFGRAAERLHIAQPPLSQAIRKLERELGVELFTRTSRKVRPTAAGHVLAEESRKVLASFAFAITETQQAAKTSSPLRVGCVAYVPTRRLQTFLSALKERDVTLQTQVMHLLSLEQVDRLRSGELDLGIFSNLDTYEGLEWAPLYGGESVTAFLAKDHPLAAKKVLTPADLADETLVTYARESNPGSSDRYLELLDQAGYRFDTVHETNPDPRDLLLAVAEGLGVVLGVPSLKETIEIDHDVVQRPISPEVSFPDTIIVWRAKPPRRLDPQLDAVREIARELRSAA
jgi:DNA-binding transcriptional LysR family regulator